MTTTITHYASTLRQVSNGAYWQGQTAAVEADSLVIGFRVARRLAWENRSRRPIIGSVVEVDRPRIEELGHKGRSWTGR